MEDITAHFKGRKYPRKNPHIRLHYSKSDERIVLTIIDCKRLCTYIPHTSQRDTSRLDKIYNDLKEYILNNSEVEIIK